MALGALPGPGRWSRVLVAALSWAATAVLADPTAADYFVHSLPGAPAEPVVKMHAGHVEITPQHNGNLFFWHFQNQHIANRQRTVIWLNGGPGCSSEDGVLMEIGPYRLKDSQHLVMNNGSWHEFANLLFVDNPVGTGFSYVDTNAYVKELSEMADQFVAFLEKWYGLFPEYEHDDIYIAGESYAGQHIPYIAKAILARNKLPSTKHQWNLKGLLIGNGWISPPEQYEAYLQFAYEKNLLQKDTQVSNELEQKWKICQSNLEMEKQKNIEKVDHPECESILQELLDKTAVSGADGKRHCYNMYDVRLRDVYPSCGMNWPPDLVNVTPYLRRADVVQALHINKNRQSGWVECNGAVGGAFRNANSKPSIDFLPDILREVPTLLFSGAEDLICNHLGTEAFIANMQWNGGKGWEVSPGNWAPRRDWTFEGQPAGFWQEARNLTYVLFYNSSHMVPFDYPRRTRDMLDRFMKVDISSVGGLPADSRLDGEKGPQTSVNSTGADADTQRKLDDAKWQAYRKSGEVVLFVVIIAASVWGYFVYRDRRRRAGYQGLVLPSPLPRRLRRSVGAPGRGAGRLDVEAADFDESELDDLHVASPADVERDRYSVGGDSDDDNVKEKPGKANGSRT